MEKDVDKVESNKKEDLTRVAGELNRVDRH